MLKPAQSYPADSASRPFVSVIVPVYNVEAYLSECLDSLIAQTFPDFEVICINDGSTDESLEILQRYACKDRRFAVASKENGGLSSARNAGLDRARGNYVCFLDSDDAYKPHALEHLAKVARTYDLDLVDFDSDTFYESKRAKNAHKEGMRKRDDVPGVMTGTELFARYEQLGQYSPSACYHLIRKEALDRANLRFEEGLLHEDELFTPLLHASMGPSMFLNEKLYLRRVREESIMTTKRTAKNVYAEFRIACELYRWMQNHLEDHDDEFVRAFFQHVYLLIDYMATHDAPLCAPGELESLAISLAPKERCAFELLVLQHRDGMQRLRRSYTESKTYRLGEAIARLPRSIARSLSKKH